LIRLSPLPQGKYPYYLATWQGKSGTSVLVTLLTLLLPRGNDSFDDGTVTWLPSDGKIGFEACISDTKLHSKATATATPQRIGEDQVRTISQLTVPENHPQ
jgi:hypothetical protein